ncbi:c-type cytochrome [Neisseria montereyensis]|uniref:C-type cytochrome n=1 Tax=Neisseria montereyensis TaxID=2973938 RepID=A0ABT2FAL9_9NEIS|nr:c-type cytochrome [Neisseria montereyensis]MCS4533155.1 c-type cytochrome [Neisseria montereyensis]
MNSLSNHKARGSALTTLLGGIVILIAVLFFLVKLAGSNYYSTVEETTQSATETRIMPAGNITMGDGTPIGQRTGEQIFNKVCIQCHAADSAVPNAPKVTHNDQWGPRIAQGLDTLFDHALNGFNAMPAKGGQADLTDDELKRAIAYMANQSGGSLVAPEVNADASGEEDASATPVSEADGQKVFESICMACHGASSAIPLSPKITHNDEWAPRIQKGKEVLFTHALEGFNGPDGGVMPAKGGNLGLSDDEVRAAVTYMVNQSGGNF